MRALTRFRQRRDVVTEGSVPSLNDLLRRARVEWHGVELHRPDWGAESHALAFSLRTLGARFLLHGIFNAYWEPLTFELPAASVDDRWRRCIDTALDSPDDIYPWHEAPIVTGATYVAQPRSVVLLALGLRRTRDGDERAVPQ